MKDKWTRFEFRKERTRSKIREAAHGLPRLSVHRSSKYFYAQVIDDVKGVTLASASSQAAGDKRVSRKNLEDAKAVGKMIAEKALKAGVTQVVFDRGGQVYAGRIKALADAARAAGLKF
jgi:large subunit ribosomal protein L18